MGASRCGSAHRRRAGPRFGRLAVALVVRLRRADLPGQPCRDGGSGRAEPATHARTCQQLDDRTRTSARHAGAVAQRSGARPSALRPQTLDRSRHRLSPGRCCGLPPHRASTQRVDLAARGHPHAGRRCRKLPPVRARPQARVAAPRRRVPLRACGATPDARHLDRDREPGVGLRCGVDFYRLRRHRRAAA